MRKLVGLLLIFGVLFSGNYVLAYANPMVDVTISTASEKDISRNPLVEDSQIMSDRGIRVESGNILDMVKGQPDSLFVTVDQGQIASFTVEKDANGWNLKHLMYHPSQCGLKSGFFHCEKDYPFKDGQIARLNVNGAWFLVRPGLDHPIVSEIYR